MPPADPPANAHPPVVTRFAPSPTGALHIGGARTALYCWAWARRHEGRFLLRIEDTDRKRSTAVSEQGIFDEMRWLGLGWDNPEVPRQSQRLGRYREAIGTLRDAGLAYDSDGAVRFRMGRDIAFDDVVYGQVKVGGGELEDFVIQKADGFPTFHLAVVVDDAEMGITHVIRGQEHLSNAAKHAALCDALGLARPTWAHTPSIMNADGSKMSKRDRAKLARAAAGDAELDSVGFDDARFKAFLEKRNDDLDLAQAVAQRLGLTLPEIAVADFRRSGYLPAVLLNYIALLGWNPGQDLERFDLDYFAGHFSFERVGKSNSKFDREKLAAFNQDTILGMSADDWRHALYHHFVAFHPEKLERIGQTGFVRFAAMYQPRSKTLDDPAREGAFFFTAPRDYDTKAVKKNLSKNEGEGLSNLAAVRDRLAGLGAWSAEALEHALETAWRELGCRNMGGVAQPLRVALTGRAVSPEIGATLELLGRDEVIRRIDACLAAHKAVH